MSLTPPPLPPKFNGGRKVEGAADAPLTPASLAKLPELPPLPPVSSSTPVAPVLDTPVIEESPDMEIPAVSPKFGENVKEGASATPNDFDSLIAAPKTEAVQVDKKGKKQKKEKTEKSEKKKTSVTTWVLSGVLLLAAGGAGAYFFLLM